MLGLGQVIKSLHDYQILGELDIKDARAGSTGQRYAHPSKAPSEITNEGRSVSKETVLSDESHESSKNNQQERIILALLEQPTLERAAAALDMSKATLWRQMQKPEFAAAFREARRDAFSQSLARLQHASNVAVNTLLRVMTDREAPAASRVRAADVVLQANVRGMEVEDIEVRVSELERAAKAAEKRA